jgi:hypothetical protein
MLGLENFSSLYNRKIQYTSYGLLNFKQLCFLVHLPGLIMSKLLLLVAEWIDLLCEVIWYKPADLGRLPIKINDFGLRIIILESCFCLDTSDENKHQNK